MASDARYRLQCLTWPEFLAGWGARWDEVLSACSDTNPFVTLQWLQAWWSAFGRPGDEEILLVLDGTGTLVGAAFLLRCTNRYGFVSMRTLRPWVNNHCQRAGLLAHPDAVRPVAESLVAHWKARRKEWDLLQLQGVAADHPLWPTLQEAARAQGCPTMVPRIWGNTWVPADRPWADYYAALNARTRASFERKTRRLKELGECTWQRHAGADALAALERYLELERRSWKAVGGEVVLDHPGLARFYRDMVGRMAAAGRCAVHVVHLAKQPVGAVVTLEYADRVFTYKTSFDAAHSKLSPGWLTYRHVLQDAFSRGYAGVDLLAHAPYTEHWGKAERPFGDLWSFSPTVRGRVARWAWRLRRSLTARRA